MSDTTEVRSVEADRVECTTVVSFKAEYVPESLKTPHDYICRNIFMQTVLEDADY